MAKDGTTVGIGVIYIVLVILQWFFLFMYYEWFGGYSYEGPFMFSFPGLAVFFGCCFLIPSFILNTIFFASKESTTTGKVGFGLGIPGWFFCFIGGLSGITQGVGTQVTALFSFIFTLGLILFGSLLFWRVYKAEGDLYPTTTTYAEPRATPPTFETSSVSLRSLQPPGPPCPKCDRATRYISEYDRYYCDSCERYV